MTGTAKLTATITALVTNNRRRDADGVIARLKAGFDALEGLVIVNDAGLRLVLSDPFFARAPGKEPGVWIVLERREE